MDTNAFLKVICMRNPKDFWFLPGSNRRPCPCEGHVITTTLRKPVEVRADFPLQDFQVPKVLFPKPWVAGELGLVAQRITRLTTDQKIAGSNPAEIETIFRNFIYFLAIESKRLAPPGGLEPPTFRLTAERASRLRHGGI